MASRHYVESASQHLHLLENEVAKHSATLHEHDTAFQRTQATIAELTAKLQHTERENKVLSKENTQNARLMVSLQTEVRGLREELRRLQFSGKK